MKSTIDSIRTKTSGVFTSDDASARKNVSSSRAQGPRKEISLQQSPLQRILQSGYDSYLDEDVDYGYYDESDSYYYNEGEGYGMEGGGDDWE